MLLDEPTSGLDTSTAVAVIAAIRDLVKGSNGNLGVMMTVHQPNSDILKLIDHFLILSQGHSVFFGTLAQAHSVISLEWGGGGGFFSKNNAYQGNPPRV